MDESLSSYDKINRSQTTLVKSDSALEGEEYYNGIITSKTYGENKDEGWID